VRGNLHYIWHEFDGGEELFDLATDPVEAYDLATADSSEEDLTVMRNELRVSLAA
jgi:hypothetical protein